MKRFMILSLVVLLLALDWAAFHDILKGEPDTTAEWLMIDMSALLFAILVFVFINKRTPKPR